MCDELGEFVDWFYRNYSGVLGISQVYVVPLGGFVLAAIHFERGSRVSGGVPVGLTIYGLGDRVEAYCSLPISCTADGRTVRMGDLIQSRVSICRVSSPGAAFLIPTNSLSMAPGLGRGYSSLPVS